MFQQCMFVSMCHVAAMAMVAIANSFGSDQLVRITGNQNVLIRACYWRRHMIGPSGLPFNFGDVDEPSSNRASPLTYTLNYALASIYNKVCLP